MDEDQATQTWKTAMDEIRNDFKFKIKLELESLNFVPYIGEEQLEQFHFVSIGTNKVATSKVHRNK